MAVKNTVQAVELLSAASSGLNGTTYTAVGSLTQSCFLIRLINNSSTEVTISYDGVTDHDFLPAVNTIGCIAEVNAQTNSQPNNRVALFSKNTTIWAKATAGTGTVKVAGYYQPTS